MTDLKNEFNQFSASSETPPASIRRAVLSRVDSDLNPSLPYVLTKLLFVHGAASIGSLAVCPQFGFRSFGEGMGLMHYFMGLGEYGCLIACGMFFSGVSLSLVLALFSRSQFRKLYENQWVGLLCLAGFSLSFFWMVDAEMILGLTLAWIAGVALSVSTLMWLGSKIKLEFNKA